MIAIALLVFEIAVLALLMVTIGGPLGFAVGSVAAIGIALAALPAADWWAHR